MDIIEALEILTSDEYVNDSGDDQYWQELNRVLEAQGYDGLGSWSMESVAQDFDPGLLAEALELAQDFQDEQWLQSPRGQINYYLTDAQTIEHLSGQDEQGNSMEISWHPKDQTWYWRGQLDGQRVSGDEQAGIYRFLDLLEDYPGLAEDMAGRL